MWELNSDNAGEYVVRHALCEPPVRVEALAWGVSNAVLLVTDASGERLVLKQSRERLRTADPWFSRLDRVWREVAVLRLLGTILPQGVVPQVRFEDRENYLFAMDAAPSDHVVWKQELLEGRADPQVALELGAILGTVHGQTAGRDDLRAAFGDTEVFVQLRVDPFYRRIAEVHPRLRVSVQAMLDEMFATPVSLVLADFSPKNVLVHSQGRGGRGLTLVDFETGHFGDPAFDLGFFLSHLLLKTIWSIPDAASVTEAVRVGTEAGGLGSAGRFWRLTVEFWESYWQALAERTSHPKLRHGDLFRRTVTHLAGCMLARIDGTSKVDYLTRPGNAEAVRKFATCLFESPPTDWTETLRMFLMIALA